jgi:hypothetical protein
MKVAEYAFSHLHHWRGVDSERKLSVIVQKYQKKFDLQRSMEWNL